MPLWPSSGAEGCFALDAVQVQIPGPRAPVRRVGAASLLLLYSSQGQEHQDQQAGNGQSQRGQQSVPRCSADLLLSQDPESPPPSVFFFPCSRTCPPCRNLCLYQERRGRLLFFWLTSSQTTLHGPLSGLAAHTAQPHHHCSGCPCPCHHPCGRAVTHSPEGN